MKPYHHVCKVCKEEFTSRSPAMKACSRVCKDALPHLLLYGNLINYSCKSTRLLAALAKLYPERLKEYKGTLPEVVTLMNTFISSHPTTLRALKGRKQPAPSVPYKREYSFNSLPDYKVAVGSSALAA